MAGEKNKKLHKGKSSVYVSLPSRRARSGGQMKTEERVKASAEKTVRYALAEGRGTMRLGPHTHVYVGGLIPTTHPDHVRQLFASCGRILHVEFICTRGTANLSKAVLPAVPLPPPPGQLPTPRRTMRPRYIEANQDKIMRQTWLYAVVYFDDASSAARALRKNGAILHGFEDTQCTIRVVSTSSELEEMQAVYDEYAVGRSVWSNRGLKREDTEVDDRLLGRTVFDLNELALRSQRKRELAAESSESSTETLRSRATADRIRWLQADSTARPGQKEAVGGLMSALNAGYRALCGISFKLTVM